MTGVIPGSRWTREELVQTLALYCQIPFGRMHSRAPEIRRLATTIGRTPASIAMKLTNFASFDPDHQRRGVRGLSGASHADRDVWDTYFGKWEALASYAEEGDHAAQRPVEDAEVLVPPKGPTEIQRMVAMRRGQTFFRRAVLAAHDGTCCITGIQEEALLRASHILPWSENVDRRLDPRNGLSLSALHDAAFDKGLITLNERLELLVSRSLPKRMPAETFDRFFAPYAGKSIRVPDRFKPDSVLLAWHRERFSEQTRGGSAR